MKYRVKAKEKCVYQNTLHKAGEEFTFEAESEMDLPGYVEVLFMHRMVTENPQGNAAGEILNGAALKTDNTGSAGNDGANGEEAGVENPPASEAPRTTSRSGSTASSPEETDKKEDKANNTKVKNKKN